MLQKKKILTTLLFIQNFMKTVTTLSFETVHKITSRVSLISDLSYMPAVSFQFPVYCTVNICNLKYVNVRLTETHQLCTEIF